MLKNSFTEVEGIVTANLWHFTLAVLDASCAACVISNLSWYGSLVHEGIESEFFTIGLESKGIPNWTIQSVVEKFDLDQCKALIHTNTVIATLARHGIDPHDLDNYHLCETFASLTGAEFIHSAEGYGFSFSDSDCTC